MSDPRQAVLAVARALALKLQRHVPQTATVQDVVDHLVEQLPPGFSLRDDEADGLVAVVEAAVGRRLGEARARYTFPRNLARRHDVVTVDTLTPLDFENLSKLTVVRAPMGFGKTQVVARSLVEAAAAAGLSVLGISPRATLTGELALRLDLRDYRDIPKTGFTPGPQVKTATTPPEGWFAALQNSPAWATMTDAARTRMQRLDEQGAAERQARQDRVKKRAGRVRKRKGQAVKTRYMGAGIATCVPSIMATRVKAALPSPDVVFIDEFSQVLRFLAVAVYCRAGGGEADTVFARLVELIRQAKHVVVADAHISRRDLAFLEYCLPGVRAHVIHRPEAPTSKTARVTVSPPGEAVLALKGTLAQQVTQALHAGERIWVATDSKVFAGVLGKMFPSVEAGRGVRRRRVLVVSSETTRTPEVKTFLADIENQSRNYDLVIASPTIASGISIEHKGNPHFTVGFFFGSGYSVTPRDAVQQMARVRYLDAWHVFIADPGGRTIRSAATRIADQIASARLEAAIREALGSDRGGVEGLQAAARQEAFSGPRINVSGSDYDAHAADTLVNDDLARAAFASELVWLLQDSGWSVTRGIIEEDAVVARALDEAKKAYTMSKWSRIAAAPTVPPDVARRLRGARAEALSVEEADTLTSCDIRVGLGLVTLTPGDVSWWDDGRVMGLLEQVEDLLDIEPLEGTLLDDTGKKLHLRAFRRARRQVYAEAFDGVDIQAGGVFTPDVAAAIVGRIMQRASAAVETGVIGARWVKRGKPRGRNRQGDVILPKASENVPILRDLFERIGLVLVEASKVRTATGWQRIYELDDEEGVEKLQGFTRVLERRNTLARRFRRRARALKTRNIRRRLGGLRRLSVNLKAVEVTLKGHADDPFNQEVDAMSWEDARRAAIRRQRD